MLNRVYPSTVVLITLLLGLSFAMHAQQLKGYVVEIENENKLPVVGATVKYNDNYRITNEEGFFEFEYYTLGDTIAIAMIGYTSRNVVADTDVVTIALTPENILDEITILSKQRTRKTVASSISNEEIITAGELKKAACCNLSESFETSPTIDVAYTDAATGGRQLQMLGLTGRFIDLQIENMPGIRGIAGSQGLNYIPGAWIKSIQVTKGIGAVTSGAESISGQVNIELENPETDRLYLNHYTNSIGRQETNLVLNTTLSPKWKMSTLLHGNLSPYAFDHNKDGFIDVPTGRQYNGLVRIHYQDSLGWSGQGGVHIINDLRETGTLHSDLFQTRSNNEYGRMWLKTGYVFPNHPNRSIGLQATATSNNYNIDFQDRFYKGNQTSYYSNLIFQSMISDTRYTYRIGVNIMHDRFEESINEISANNTFINTGIWGDMNVLLTEKWSLLPAFRWMHHSYAGWLPIPRLHVKYEPNERHNLKLGAGRGVLIETGFNELQKYLFSNRNFFFENNDMVYKEAAWNMGINYVHKIYLPKGLIEFVTDYYYTHFQSFMNVDPDRNAQEIHVSTVNNNSFAHHFQTEINYEPNSRFEARVAYKWTNAQSVYNNTAMEMPFVAAHKAFVHGTYSLPKWQFSATAQWHGNQRLPDTRNNPEAYRFAERSPNFVTVQSQISYDIKKNFTTYFGVENLTNYIQKDRIISASNPSTPFFDGSMIWGPLMGRMLYAGIRWEIR